MLLKALGIRIERTKKVWEILSSLATVEAEVIFFRANNKYIVWLGYNEMTSDNFLLLAVKCCDI